LHFGLADLPWFFGKAEIVKKIRLDVRPYTMGFRPGRNAMEIQSGRISTGILPVILAMAEFGSCQQDFPLTNLVDFMQHKKFDCDDLAVANGKCKSEQFLRVKNIAVHLEPL
jgi:hypothetical protein